MCIYISFDMAYIWNTEKGYKRTDLQNQNRVTDVENKLNWGAGYVYIYTCVYTCVYIYIYIYIYTHTYM